MSTKQPVIFIPASNGQPSHSPKTPGVNFFAKSPSKDLAQVLSRRRLKYPPQPEP